MDNSNNDTIRSDAKVTKWCETCATVFCDDCVTKLHSEPHLSDHKYYSVTQHYLRTEDLIHINDPNRFIKPSNPNNPNNR